MGIMVMLLLHDQSNHSSSDENNHSNSSDEKNPFLCRNKVAYVGPLCASY